VVRSSNRRRRLYLAVVTLALAVPLALDRPWYWVTIDTFAAAPDPCAVLAAGPASSLGLSGPGTPKHLDVPVGLAGSSCTWIAQGQSLALTTVVASRTGLMSGTGVAAQVIHDEWWWGESYARDRTKDVDLGNGGRIELSGFTALVIVRYENLLILVEYYVLGALDPEARAIDITRHAIEFVSAG
jgi:hypothetical protein